MPTPSNVYELQPARRRELRDALGGELFDEPDVVLEAIVADEVGAVSETTRELARLEL